MVRPCMRGIPAVLLLVVAPAALADQIGPTQAFVESVTCTIAGTAAAGTIALLVLPKTGDPGTLVGTSIGAGALGAASLVVCPSLGRLHAGLNAGSYFATRALTLLGGAALVAALTLGGGVYGAIAGGLIVGPLTGTALVVEGIYDIATTSRDVEAAIAPMPSGRGIALALRF
jgi:hypothetical protein